MTERQRQILALLEKFVDMSRDYDYEIYEAVRDATKLLEKQLKVDEENLK